MAASDNEKARLRLETGDDATSLADADIDIIFAIVEEQYSGYSREVIYIAARLLRRRNLLAQSRKLVDHSFNEESEKLSQISKGLEADVKADEMALATEISDTKPAVGIARARRKPSRPVERPYGGKYH